MRSTAVLDNTTSALRAAWHVVATADEVGTEPHQVWLLGQPWVLVRLDGELCAFADRCPHRLAPLSAGSVVGSDAGQTLQCGYHGWRFAPSGECVEIPALGKTESISRRATLGAPFGLREVYGLVWLAPEQPHAEVPEFPEWGATGFDSATCTLVRTPVSAAQLVDNFLDASHFPYVHAASFGVPESAEVVDSGIGRTEWTVRTTFSTCYREQGQVQPQELLKVGSASYAVQLRLDFPEQGFTIGILFVCQPESADSTRVYKLVARDDLGGDPVRVAGFVKEEDDILTEDLVVLERYPHRELFLDPRVEMHTRADRLSLAWRSLLGELVAAHVPA